MASSFALPEALWSGFVRDHWEKKPALLKQLFTQPIATAEETMPALIRASDSYRANHLGVAASFFIETARVIAELFNFSNEGFLQILDRNIADHFRLQSQNLMPTDQIAFEWES